MNDQYEMMVGGNECTCEPSLVPTTPWAPIAALILRDRMSQVLSREKVETHRPNVTKPNALVLVELVSETS